MWGGRFAATPSDIMEEINASLDIDRRMAAEDIAGSPVSYTHLTLPTIYSV